MFLAIPKIGLAVKPPFEIYFKPMAAPNAPSVYSILFFFSRIYS